MRMVWTHVGFFLASDTCTSHQLPVDSILSLIRLVLENNHFRFNNDNYLQKTGTAMGSPMAPAYASLFMGKLEQDFIQSKKISNDQELIQSDPTSFPQNQKGNN